METPVTPRFALLQALVRGPGYGLELIERVKKVTKGQIVLHQGTVYPALREMEDEGLLESYEGPALPERGGRPRRYYALTGLGAKAAMEEGRVVRGLVGLALEAAR
jgi:PadR family transcriptional regulator PadR